MIWLAYNIICMPLIMTLCIEKFSFQACVCDLMALIDYKLYNYPGHCHWGKLHKTTYRESNEILQAHYYTFTCPWITRKTFGRVAIIKNAPRVIFSTNFAVSMSVQTTYRQESASQEEEDDEEFIKESTKLAKSFTEFFISSQAISGREYLEYWTKQ